MKNRLYDPIERMEELLGNGSPTSTYFAKNLLAIENEDLKDSCHVAAELGWRDWKIEQLQEEIKSFKMKG